MRIACTLVLVLAVDSAAYAAKPNFVIILADDVSR